jgi:hypothetical protein
MKLLKRKKSQAAWSWIMGLAFLFALGILYSVFLFVFEANLVPTILTITNQTISDPAQRALVSDGIAKYMVYFKLMPFILFAVVVIYMIATTIYKQSSQM